MDKEQMPQAGIMAAAAKCLVPVQAMAAAVQAVLAVSGGGQVKTHKTAMAKVAMWTVPGGIMAAEVPAPAAAGQMPLAVAAAVLCASYGAAPLTPPGHSPPQTQETYNHVCISTNQNC
jgi:hypothetical protein